MSLEELLLALSACLCEEFQDVCECGILPGSTAALDHCGSCAGEMCGQAWVLLEQVHSSEVFPQESEFSRCGSPLVAVMRVGVARCAPVPDASGEPPDGSDLELSGLQGARDAMAAHRAVSCCLSDQDILYSVGPWVTGTPSGGCVDGSMRVMVEVTD